MILFPHSEIRESQKEFMDDILECLKNKKHLLAHAPTGIGKTAAVLSTCLPFAIKNKKTIMFLTTRHTQHKIVIETLKKISTNHKKEIKVADFIGKKWMCLHPGVTQLSSSEFAEYCSKHIEKKTCDLFNNIKNKGKLSIETKLLLEGIKEPLAVEKIKQLCKEKSLCPYEITSLIAKDAQIIIGDYFHMLDPHIRDSLLKKANKQLEDVIIIFDEAHNLPSRSRDLLTNKLSLFIIDNAIKEAQRLGFEQIAESITEIKNRLNELLQKTKLEENERIVKKEEFIFDNHEQIIGDLNFIGEQILETKKSSFCNFVSSFLESWLGPEEGFTRILTKDFDKKGNPVVILSYRCLNPSILLKPLADTSLIIGMSGTLMPLEMYKHLLDIDAEIKEYKDPFPKTNRINIIIPKTTTKFTHRNEEMYTKIATLSSAVINHIPGNSAIFFPSYDIRDKVNTHFQKLCEKTSFLEHPGLLKEEKEELLENFKKYKETGAVLLGASSGSLGEGIDLPGDFLKAVLIVGLPLSKPSLETKELIKYYQERFNRGWDYGYLYPAMIKSIQNAGRCIRTKKDRGIIAFMDERYIWPNYYKCFPKDWEIKITNYPVKQIKEFFNTNN